MLEQLGLGGAREAPAAAPPPGAAHGGLAAPGSPEATCFNGGDSDGDSEAEAPSQWSSAQEMAQSAAALGAQLPQGALHPSVGSQGHASGTCKRCCFFPRGRCVNGYSCGFCHYEHAKPPRKHRGRQGKRGPTGGQGAPPLEAAVLATGADVADAQDRLQHALAASLRAQAQAVAAMTAPLGQALGAGSPGFPATAPVMQLVPGLGAQAGAIAAPGGLASVCPLPGGQACLIQHPQVLMVPPQLVPAIAMNPPAPAQQMGLLTAQAVA